MAESSSNISVNNSGSSGKLPPTTSTSGGFSDSAGGPCWKSFNHFKAFAVRWMNAGLVVLAVFGLLMLVASWSASVEFEGNQLKRRHVASIIGFCLVCVSVIFFICCFKCEPLALLLYTSQALTALSLFLTAVSMGMNSLVVDLCSAGEVNQNSVIKDSITGQKTHGIHCSAHYSEYVGSLFVCMALAGMFFAVQQQIVGLVDKGVMRGIGSRMARLP